MGRDVKRVHLDFDWPRGEVWEGYLTPDRFHESPCPAGPACLRGETAARAWVAQVTRLSLMLDDDRAAQERGRPMHPYFDSFPKPWRTGGVPRPSPDIAEFGAGLAGRESGSLGHDSLDQWQAEKKILRAAGLDPDVWGICPECAGHGSVEAYPGQRAEAEAWEPTGPPEGEGWQLWETVSEGSPVSPVLTSGEDLAQWLTTPEGGEVTGPSRRPMTIEQARGFVDAGWAPSMILNAGGVHDGATYIGTEAALDDSPQWGPQ
ncbi:MAG: hypothetical protein ACRDTT_16385 [Pseudonocardiaceae bacterium]